MIANPSHHLQQMVLDEKSSLDQIPGEYGPEVKSRDQAPVFQENAKSRLTMQAPWAHMFVDRDIGMLDSCPNHITCAQSNKAILHIGVAT